MLCSLIALESDSCVKLMKGVSVRVWAHKSVADRGKNDVWVFICNLSDFF